MHKRKLATLVAASFAGLMLSSPSFATDASKAQITGSAGGALESRSTERADKKASASDASRNSGMKNHTASERAAASQKAEADAKAEYKVAIEKCDSQPTGQRSACVQDAKAAQTLALQQSRDGTPASGAPESRSTERADEKAAKSDASRNTAMKNQTDSNTPRKTGAPESRSAERADKKVAASKEDAAAAKADYDAAMQKCDALPSGERSSCVRDAKDAQSLVMNGSSAKRGAPESRIVGPQSAK